MMPCPACGESRWISPRLRALGAFAKRFTRWQPYRCQACGWRGWSRSHSDRDNTSSETAQDTANDRGDPTVWSAGRLFATAVFRSLRERIVLLIRAFAAARSAVSRRIDWERLASAFRWLGGRVVAAMRGVAPAGSAVMRGLSARRVASAVGPLHERAAHAIRGLPAAPFTTRRGVAAGLIGSLAVVVVLVAVLWSRGETTNEPLASAPAAVPTVRHAPDQKTGEAPSGAPVMRTAAASATAPAPNAASAKQSATPPKVSGTPPVANAPSAGDGRPAERRTTAAAGPRASTLPQFRGSLRITSEPEGAVVTVDGRVVGATPVVLKDVRVGSRVVRIESNGYEPWSTAARVAAAKVTSVKATLQRGSTP